MVFSDLFFLFAFIPAFAITYLLANWVDKHLLYKGDNNIETHGEISTNLSKPGFKARNFTLVVFSLIFYAWGEAVYLFLMLISVIINYFIGRWIGASETKGWRKTALIVGLISNLSILGTFKYLGFFSDTLAQFGIETNAPRLSLPIGISFYIFQSISYLVDVYRRDTPVQKRFMDLLLYISMFPQLIAGPIVRYGTVAHELHDRHVSSRDFVEGSYRFFIGLGKKVIFANMLSEISTLFLADGVETLSIWGAWIGLIAFTLQIYFDFSGYSDMAIGLGRCMGFHFNENFNHPYCCDTVTDFWRRWHMSLGGFFRDYTYIPMGGNRRHQVINLLTVWFLTGMWHGASWNFIIWGLYFGLILAIEKVSIMKVKDKIPRFLLRIYSLTIVVIGWGIFYFDNFDKMGEFFRSATGQRSLEFGLKELTALTDNFWLWILAIILCIPIRKWFADKADAYSLSHPGGAYVVSMARIGISVCLLLLSVALLVGATNNAFIYTRF